MGCVPHCLSGWTLSGCGSGCSAGFVVGEQPGAAVVVGSDPDVGDLTNEDLVPGLTAVVHACCLLGQEPNPQGRIGMWYPDASGEQ